MYAYSFWHAVDDNQLAVTMDNKRLSRDEKQPIIKQKEPKQEGKDCCEQRGTLIISFPVRVISEWDKQSSAEAEDNNDGGRERPVTLTVSTHILLSRRGTNWARK